MMKQHEQRRRITNIILTGCVRAVCMWFDQFWLIVPWQYEQAAWQLSSGSDSNIPAFWSAHFYNFKLVITERRKNMNCIWICQKNKEGITFRDKTTTMICHPSCPDDDHFMTIVVASPPLSRSPNDIVFLSKVTMFSLRKLISVPPNIDLRLPWNSHNAIQSVHV